MNELGKQRGVYLAPGNVVHDAQVPVFGIGVLAAVACVVGWIQQPEQFFRSYLVAVLFWLGIAIGSLALLMIYNITGGAWGAVTRRVLESATRTVPALVVLFFPLLFGLEELYEWARPEHVAHDELLRHKSTYLNVPFFVARAVFYFAVWFFLVWLLNHWSARQDTTTEITPALRLEMTSRGGLVLVGLTMTFASIDWGMSLEPHWFSTIYGILMMGGQVVSAMAFLIPMIALLSSTPKSPLHGVVGKEQLHDLGKFLFAFIMLWTYFALSQFLITWSANLPEEIPWYLKRTAGGWQWVALAVILLHFVLPFALLLSREVKRRPVLLAAIAAMILTARLIDLYWMITPAFFPAKLHVHWLDLAAVLAVGGLWFAVYVRELKRRSLVAVNDPSLPVRHAA